ncbi:MAG: Transglutaminase-like superfamily protein [Planctomycetaceae bacterium]|nr:Transglutaminase-like superfamily protein [Planctomycetaceae bacterium]
MNTKSSSAKPLRAEILPLLMAIVALITVESAQYSGGQPRWHVAVKVGLLAIVMVGLYRGCSQFGANGLHPGRLASPLLIGIAVLPLLVEVLQNWVWQTGNPLEVLLLAGFRNLACGLAVLSYLPAYNRVCSVISLFLIVFASCITGDLFVQSLVIVYALCGVWWLMGLYWDSLQAHLTGSSSQNRFPRRFLFTIPLFLIVLVCLTPLAAPQVASALPGFMPTSGGNQSSDPNARSGVNDGEALVPATDQARSFGPVETDVFMESEQPSLYDIFNDMYGEPPKKKNTKQDRAIALPPGLLQHTHDRMAQQKKLGQQFSTVRSTRSNTPKKLRDIEGTAVLYVGGRVPLHLRMETFDIFDGVEWFPESPSARTSGLNLEIVGAQPWIRIDGLENDKVSRKLEPHQLKIINLRTNRIPAPLGLTGIHIDKVDRVDMFRWAQESIVKMDRERLPELTVIHLQSQTADARMLEHESIRKSIRGPQFQQLPSQIRSEEIRSLAKEWVGNLPDGWPRVEAILAQLRSRYLLDRDYRPASNCRDTVSEFLLESKRGPDYVFASAAAVLLRHLGYSTRVVSGFYADPEKFDRQSQHTPVTATDVHFWAEVYVGQNSWMTVEATPGYDVLSPPRGIWGSLVKAVALFMQHLRHHLGSYSLFFVASVVVCWRRIEISDWVTTLLWRVRPIAQPRCYVLRTLALVKQRARWAGIPHSDAHTASRWLRELSARLEQDNLDLATRFSHVIDWAAYAPPHLETPPRNDVPVLCQMVAKEWTLARLRQFKTHP